MLWFVGRLQGGQSMILKCKNNSVGIAQSVYSSHIRDGTWVKPRTSMIRGPWSSLVASFIHYLLSLKELRYWILRFDEECFSNGAFLMHHVPKSVKYLYIDHDFIASCTQKKLAALTVHSTVDGEGRRRSNCYSLWELFYF